MQNQDFKLSPSRIYAVFLTVMLTSSMIILLLLALPLGEKVIGAALMAGYGAIIFWRYVLLRAPLSIVSLQQVEAGKWRVMTQSNAYVATIRGDSTVTAFLSVLRFDLPGIRRPVSSIIFRDSLAAEAYRQLVGVVRMGG